ncbi:hypothetical protein AA0113_g9730 [Alternaria arborescens]|uniref:Phytanoyl-CoA dioxygenase n=1 Tax=Alternaria arborescens TaxID=156630 RepID=A0A4Q4QYR0_9PLEO|nr:hypothetical protein AA0113_g9730 [Alternaria arborescens]
MLQRIPLSRPDEAIKAIEEDGGVILSDFTSLNDLDQVHQDEWQARYKGRVYCSLLYGRSETAREKWILDSGLQHIVNHFLHTSNSTDVDPNSPIGRRTDSILSQATSIATLEGGLAQALHRDDSIWQHVHPNQEKSGYRLGTDLGMGLLVPGVNTTMANGATLFVPGSHLWADERQAGENETIAVEMLRGEALLFLSSAIHAGGGNVTREPRLLHAIFFCRSWVRPEANDFTCYTIEEVESWSAEAQKFAGYRTDKMLGICDDGDPIDALRIRQEKKL